MLIITKYVAATDTHGERIRATAPHYGMSVTVGWDYGCNSGGGVCSNHWEAARALCAKFNASEHAKFAGARETLRFVGSAGRDGYAYAADGFGEERHSVELWTGAIPS